MTLHFIGGITSDCKVTKEGNKYTYFTAQGNGVKYRVDKATGDVQVSPYWDTIKGMYVEK